MKAHISVMSSGSAEPALGLVAAAFEKETGHAVSITYNLGAEGSKRLGAGENFDVLVATSNSIKRSYGPAGLVESGGVSVGRVGLGIMVRPGAPVPDVSSVGALKHAVLDAERILITTETSGLYIESTLKKLEIYAQVERKISRSNTGPSLMDRVLAGKGREIAFLSPNAILTYKDKGLVFAGPLPEELQLYREFMAVSTTGSANKEIARAFARYCGGPGKALFVAHGFS